MCYAWPMKTLTLTIAPHQAGRTAQSLLTHEMQVSATLLRRLKGRPMGIALNGVRVNSTVRVAQGDVLTADVSDAVHERPGGKAIPLSILYEDEDILILNKPAGLPVHSSTREPGRDTLEDALYAYLPPDVLPHPVSRLDRGTTGVITFAKSGYVHELMRRALHTGAFHREYLAIALDVFPQEQGLVDLPIGFEENSRYKRAVRQNGAPAQTEYQVLGQKGGLAFLRLTPRTGRTHQIRVHMAAMGHPLLGDWLYGEENEAMGRPALHSAQLWLTHPITGESLRIAAPLPEDMARFWPEDALFNQFRI